MSRVYFHSEAGTAEVWGGERALANVTLGRLAGGLLETGPLSAEDIATSRLFAAIPPDHYLRRLAQDGRWFDALKTCFQIGDLPLTIDDVTTDSFSLVLNTALVIGNPALIFLAKLHAQCEIHGYVEGPDRAWLADVITEAIQRRLLRDQMGEHPTGWTDVITLLRSDATTPVVTSYSVCDQFPNQRHGRIGGWVPPPDTADEYGESDAWYDVPADEQWRWALAGLRSNQGGPVWTPETWSHLFDPGLSVFDLIRP